MRTSTKGALIGAGAFAVVSVAFATWYVMRPGDQFTFLFILGMPLDIPGLAIMTNEWGIWQQTGTIAVLGMLQYGALGYAVGRALKSADNPSPRWIQVLLIALPIAVAAFLMDFFVSGHRTLIIGFALAAVGLALGWTAVHDRFARPLSEYAGGGKRKAPTGRIERP
jgi:hypothetical protein